MVDTITIISPNGGEAWLPGSVQIITWISTGTTLGPNVKIELWKGGILNQQIVFSTPNTGSYTWTVPTTLTLDTNYKIRIMGCTLDPITSKCTAYPADMSNSNFTIGTYIPPTGNLLQNSGFELADTIDPTKPKNWGTYGSGTLQIFTYPETGMPPSTKSVGIEYPSRDLGKTAAYIQNVIVDSTKAYKLAGWIKTDNIVGKGARIQVDWKSSTWAYISSSYIMPFKTGTSDWAYYNGIVIPPTNAYVGAIVPQIHDASGKAWFDDMLFEETIAPVCPTPQVTLTIPT